MSIWRKRKTEKSQAAEERPGLQVTGGGEFKNIHTDEERGSSHPRI